jgi:hypothetical protein
MTLSSLVNAMRYQLFDLAEVLYIQRAYYQNHYLGMCAEDYLLSLDPELYEGIEGVCLGTIVAEHHESIKRPHPLHRNPWEWGDTRPCCPLSPQEHISWARMVKLRRGPWPMLALYGWLL